ncbi:MAG: SRPBCC family protein [Chloroflexi bacterium]|nr:SRPBCC family protein [Chloroflexota bacterium]
MKQITKVSNLIVADFTNARLMVDQSVDISATPEKIWRVINNQSIAEEWLPSVKKLESFDTSKANADGVGVERIAVYGTGDKIKETVVYAEKNKILAYRVAFPYMVKDHLSIIEIKENGLNSSTVHLYAFFTPTDFTGYLMQFGVYASIVKSSLRKLNELCSK